MIAHSKYPQTSGWLGLELPPVGQRHGLEELDIFTENFGQSLQVVRTGMGWGEEVCGLGM